MRVLRVEHADPVTVVPWYYSGPGLRGGLLLAGAEAVYNILSSSSNSSSSSYMEGGCRGGMSERSTDLSPHTHKHAYLLTIHIHTTWA